MNPYNNLLRPKAELMSAGVSGGLAVVTFSLQEAMLFVPEIGLSLSGFFAVSASLSAVKGFGLYRYHRGLSCSVPYAMASNQIFKSESVYFVGMGFEWTAEHTKRIKDLYDRRNTTFLYASKREKAIRNWALLHQYRWYGGAIYRFLNSYNILNPYPPRNESGTAATHGIGTWEGEEKIYLGIDHTNHLLVMGGTGSGKSCAFMMLCAQDIEANRPTIGLDPKGGYKIFAAMYDAAVRNQKVQQFKIIHLAFPEQSCQYNAIGSYHRITEISGRLTEGIDSEESFKQFAWLKSNFIAVGLHFLGEQATFDKIKYYMTRCDELVHRYCEQYVMQNAKTRETIKRFAAAVDEPGASGKGRVSRSSNLAGHDARMIASVQVVEDLIEQGEIPDSTELRAMMSYAQENVMHERKLIRNIEPILEKLTTGSIAQIMVPDYDNLDSTRPILDWGQLINDGEVVYIGTNALGDITVSSTFIQILLEDLTNYLGARYQYGQDYGRLTPAKDDSRFLSRNIALHIDELSAVRTKAVKNLLARGGELGLKMRVYTQSHADLVTTFGSREDAESAIDNFGAIMMFRVNNPHTADILISRLNKVGIEKEGRVFGYADSSTPETPEDFSSSAMQREEDEITSLLSHQNVMSLPTGEAFVLTNGQKLEKVRVPLIQMRETGAPASNREMIAIMKQNDRSPVGPIDYSDTWFRSVYPEYAEGTLGSPGGPENHASDLNEKQKKKDSYEPLNVMTDALHAEIGAEAAEFSLHGGLHGQ